MDKVKKLEILVEEYKSLLNETSIKIPKTPFECTLIPFHDASGMAPIKVKVIPDTHGEFVAGYTVSMTTSPFTRSYFKKTDFERLIANGEYKITKQ